MGSHLKTGWGWPLSYLHHENPEKTSEALWRCLILIFLFIISHYKSPDCAAVLSIVGPLEWSCKRTPIPFSWGVLAVDTFPRKRDGAGDMAGSRCGPAGVAGLVVKPHPKICGVFCWCKTVSVLDLRLCVYMLFAAGPVSGLWHKQLLTFLSKLFKLSVGRYLRCICLIRGPLFMLRKNLMNLCGQIWI